MTPRTPTLPALALVLAPLLSACSHRNHIEPGPYTAHHAPLGGTTLSIDAAKREVTITPPGSAAVKRSAKVWEASKWPTLCPRGMYDTASEVLDLGPDPLTIGSTKVDHPLLVADCLGKPSVDLMPLGADGQPKKPPVASFER